MGQVAHGRIDCRTSRPAVYRALAHIPARVYPQTQEHRRAARPLLQQLARKIAPAQYGRNQARRISSAAFAAASGTAAGPRSRAVPGTSSADARPADVGRP